MSEEQEMVRKKDSAAHQDRYYGDDLGYGFEFFFRIRPSLHSHGANEHAEHVAGMENDGMARPSLLVVARERRMHTR